MSRITRAAKMRACSLRLPGGCSPRETVVFAHAPSVASGTGHKSPDFWGAFACARCHDIADGRRHTPAATRVLITERWLKGIFETQSILFKENLLKEM